MRLTSFKTHLRIRWSKYATIQYSSPPTPPIVPTPIPSLPAEAQFWIWLRNSCCCCSPKSPLQEILSYTLQHSFTLCFCKQTQSVPSARNNRESWTIAHGVQMCLSLLADIPVCQSAPPRVLCSVNCFPEIIIYYYNKWISRFILNPLT